MPGPVSDSYDPEFTTGERADEFEQCLVRLHGFVGGLIGKPPVDYRTLPDLPPGETIMASLPEREWRFIRYALETARAGLTVRARDPRNRTPQRGGRTHDGDDRKSR